MSGPEPWIARIRTGENDGKSGQSTRLEVLDEKIVRSPMRRSRRSNTGAKTQEGKRNDTLWV